jgi:hypothetical protein
MRYVISSQNHQVWAKVIRHAHGFVDSLFVQKRAVMNVGKLNYAQTLKFSGKFIYSDYLMSDLDLMRFDHGRSQDRGESLAPLPAATAMFAFEGCGRRGRDQTSDGTILKSVLRNTTKQEDYTRRPP